MAKTCDAFSHLAKREGYLAQLVPALEHAMDRAELDRIKQHLRAELAALRPWYDATLGREERVMEFRRQVNELLVRLSEPTRYPNQGRTHQLEQDSNEH